MNLIEVKSLCKSFSSKKVLDNLCVQIQKGKTYYLKGENGCGKSTFTKILLGLVKYKKGSIIFTERRMSYIPEKMFFPEYITVIDFLVSFASLEANKETIIKIDGMLSLFSLDKAKYKMLGNLSKGMLQKVLIINSLIVDVPLYIFDEPLSGLDVNAKAIFINQIKILKKRGKTIIIISHNIDLFKELIDEVVELTCLNY